MGFPLIFYFTSYNNANHKPLNWFHNSLTRHDSLIEKHWWRQTSISMCNIPQWNIIRMYAWAYARTHVYICVYVHTHIHREPVLFVDSVFVNLPTPLKFIHTLNITTHSTFSVMCRRAQSCKKKSWSRSQLRLNKAMLISCLSSEL